MRPAIKVGLSTASVYPLRTEAAFEYAAELGYDGVELMVWAETVSQDIGAIAKLAPVQHAGAVRACAVSVDLQRVWGPNPIPKLTRSVQAAERLGAQTVVVHPPFRWQRRYADGFSEQVAELETRSDVLVAVENMFPVPRRQILRLGPAVDRADAQARGRPGAAVSAFAPSYDPLDGNHAHYTLDLSHTATAGTDALDMARRMGSGLVHLHLCDGTGASTDEHLVPGRGSQPTVEVCQMLAGSDFAGHVILEVTTSDARNKAEREALLAESLQFARSNLLR